MNHLEGVLPLQLQEAIHLVRQGGGVNLKRCCKPPTHWTMQSGA
jgi:hypothetical protein